MHDSVDQIHGDGSFKLLEKYLTRDDREAGGIARGGRIDDGLEVYFDGFYYEGLKRGRPKVKRFQSFKRSSR